MSQASKRLAESLEETIGDIVVEVVDSKISDIKVEANDIDGLDDFVSDQIDDKINDLDTDDIRGFEDTVNELISESIPGITDELEERLSNKDIAAERLPVIPVDKIACTELEGFIIATIKRMVATGEFKELIQQTLRKEAKAAWLRTFHELLEEQQCPTS